MSAPPGSPRKRNLTCACCGRDRKPKTRYCKRCQTKDCEHYPNACRNAVVRPRHLSRSSVPPYTTVPAFALPGEPEAISDTDLERIAKKAREDDRLRQAKQQDIPLEERLARARAKAQANGVDITRQEASVRERIEVIERKVRGKAA